MSGLEIKEFRKKHGLTQLELSKILNVTIRAVQSWEQGVAKIPKKYTETLEYYSSNDLLPFKNNGVIISINDLIELLKDKDQQIKELTGKLLELTSSIIKN